MNSWYRLLHAAAFGTFVIGLGACTYHGAAKMNIYSPTESKASVVEKKLAIKVAVLKIKASQNRALHVGGGDFSAMIKYDEALTNAVETALGGIVSAVRVIDDPTKAESGELLAECSMQYRGWRRDWNTLFTLRLKDSESGLVVAEAQHADSLHYSEPPGAWAGAVVTGLSVMVLSPITFPLISMAVGHEAEKLVEDVIRSSVSDTSAKLVMDPRLIAFVKARNRLDTVAVASARPNQAESRTMPPSKYDDFLNAVVVVRSSGGVGTGFFVNERGHVITNRHVVGQDATVSLKLRAGSVMIGTVIASDVNADLALISVPQESPAWLELARAEEGGVGADVIAIGTPEGLGWSVSKGIVSALREVGTTRLVQTDAPINRGNSGGPLILLESGRVIGVNTFGFRKDLAEGLNFAVSAQVVGAAFGPYLKR